MRALSDEQRGVRRGMFLGATTSAVVIAAGSWLAVLPPMATTNERLAWLLPWFSLLGLPLAAGIAAIAAHRFLHPSVIDGSNDPTDVPLGLHRAFLQNTLEQTVLAQLALLALTAVLPTPWLGTLPIAVLWFVVARLVFRTTYAKGAAARSFGFAATFYPSLSGLVIAAMCMAFR